MTSATLIEKCCLVANPAAGDPTQYLVEQAFAQKSLDWRFMTFEVDPPTLGDAMRGIRALGFHGVKIGEPFQASVVEYLDELTDAAKSYGSVNSVTAKNDKLVGDNTEGAAFVELVGEHVKPAGGRAVIIGSGRLAKVLAMAMADAGVNAFTVLARNTAAGEELAGLLGQRKGVAAKFTSLGSGAISVDAEATYLVNATSLSSRKPDAKLPINPDSITSKMVVCDVGYNVARTWLTRHAAERGSKIVDGLALYVQQTALAFQKWTGVKPDTNSMREAAEEFLGV